MSDSTVQGVLVLARHGDRQGFYQDPTTYTASATSITPLGNVQEQQLGALLRSMYLNASSPDWIAGVNPTIFTDSQVLVRADGSDEGGVIVDSALSLLAGLWPPTTAWNTTLANGTTVVGPFNGYQYVPLQTINADEDISLEGNTQCNTWANSNTAFYNSSGFLQVANESAAFLSLLPPFLDGRPVTLQNMVFDYMNVQSIHNKTFFDRLPPTFLAQARALANYHEYGIFTSPQLNGIGNVVGQAILPTMFSALNRISNSSDPLKLAYNAISYKPFLSLFNMTGVAQSNPELAGVVNYAASVVFEVRTSNASSEPLLRFRFKNGTDDAEYTTFNLFGSNGDIPLSQFINTLTPAGINNTQEWCGICNNSVNRGCAAFAAQSALPTSAAHSGSHVSAVGAGFIGAGVTLALMAVILAVLAFGGLLTLFPRRRKGGSVRITSCRLVQC
ncbi:phosphoglycerate mutase-like protein [Sistotremastrum niveocremeum HHB9708]|uniref:Phosphoglycerate mutase-like protein n=1 Tax=Sistotremastrum niveocremeum HHB9708 TaxID=1314777 RepID=A0A164RFE8_9AGAM|nr:phosphoglycerate mutase-like protein [Sistotremastrum niveocremeum HHB9708]